VEAAGAAVEALGADRLHRRHRLVAHRAQLALRHPPRLAADEQSSVPDGS
jgi:hypothetical protein